MSSHLPAMRLWAVWSIMDRRYVLEDYTLSKRAGYYPKAHATQIALAYVKRTTGATLKNVILEKQ